jgi:hypothetical protein
MTIMQMLVTGMILIIIATVTLAVLSYGAFKVRERRSPRRAAAPASSAPMFFERVRLNTAQVRREE